ncbi:MAG: hypothetical protein HXY40_14105 [Chloroflexi bacterium]|nr:hypothetical protein [Chloroflexota bacterium]
MGEQKQMIDGALLAFLRDKVNSFIKWDIVRFFHDNPYARDTSEHIARYIMRDAHTTARELHHLAETQVVEAEEIGTVLVYRLTPDEATRELIGRFVAACDDREFRVQAINEVINGKRLSPRHDF